MLCAHDSGVQRCRVSGTPGSCGCSCSAQCPPALSENKPQQALDQPDGGRDPDHRGYCSSLM